MKITNKHGLPLPLVAAVQADAYSKGDADYSVTELVDAPERRALMRKHGDAVEEDVSDRIWSLMGQVTHAMLERAAPMLPAGVVVERRWFADVAGSRISGQCDYYDARAAHDPTFRGHLLQDYKLTKVWSVIRGVKPEWEAQMNMLLLLADGDEACPLSWETTDLSIVALLRDWSKLERLRMAKDGYPDAEVIVLPVRKWSKARAEEYMAERVRLHQQADDDFTVGRTRFCSPEDRWQKPTTWAAKKGKNKRAARVLSSLIDAEAWIVANPHKADTIEERPGEDTRCLHYCSVAPWCAHGKAQQNAARGAVMLDGEVLDNG